MRVQPRAMKRRALLKNLGMGLGAISLPQWANAWQLNTLPKTVILEEKSSEMLKLLVDTLIPASDIPGAAELGVDAFVNLMVNDMATKTDKDDFFIKLNEVDTYARQELLLPFDQLSTNGRETILNRMAEDADWKGFFGLLKRYTIQGYMSSEYIMTNINHYEMAPGFYHGCEKI